MQTRKNRVHRQTNMTQQECFKVAFVDKVLPGISDTFKEHRDAANILGFF